MNSINDVYQINGYRQTSHCRTNDASLLQPRLVHYQCIPYHAHSPNPDSLVHDKSRGCTCSIMQLMTSSYPTTSGYSQCYTVSMSSAAKSLASSVMQLTNSTMPSNPLPCFSIPSYERPRPSSISHRAGSQSVPTSSDSSPQKRKSIYNPQSSPLSTMSTRLSTPTIIRTKRTASQSPNLSSLQQRKRSRDEETTCTVAINTTKPLLQPTIQFASLKKFIPGEQDFETDTDSKGPLTPPLTIPEDVHHMATCFPISNDGAVVKMDFEEYV